MQPTVITGASRAREPHSCRVRCTHAYSGIQLQTLAEQPLNERADQLH